MTLTPKRIKKWDMSLLKRARKLGIRVFSVKELDTVRKEINRRKK